VVDVNPEITKHFSDILEDYQFKYNDITNNSKKAIENKNATVIFNNLVDIVSDNNEQLIDHTNTLRKIRDCAERDLGMSVRSKQIDDGRERIEALREKNEVLKRMVTEWEDYDAY